MTPTPRYYAGIGSRQTPQPVLNTMRRLAAKLAEHNFVLRSGGAEGADAAFEQGAKAVGAPTQVFRPNHANPMTPSGAWAHQIAQKYHPAWFALRSPYVRSLMARNTFQILGFGPSEPLSAFVLCWTPDGAENTTSRRTGGTGQAIRIAIAHNIPVLNLYNPFALEHLNQLILP